MSSLPPPGHRPGRKGHRILRRLAESRAPFHELQEAAHVEPLSAEGRRFYRMLDAMRRDGLITMGRPNSTYAITDTGRDALRRLNAGERVETESHPNVRTFIKAPTHA